MSENPEAQPIIIKKVAGHGHGHHGGAWKVAYADFVTAMMAFFLVMWIVGQSKETKAGVAGYFRDPGAFEGGKGILMGVEYGTTGGGHTGGPGSVKPTDVQSATEVLEGAAEQLKKKLASMAGFKDLQDRVDVTVTDEGLRIELREAPDDGFFGSGSAALKPEGVAILKVVADQLASMDRGVAVEGHTDSRPYASATGYTNWELSADRANAARRVLEAGGLSAQKIEAVRGYADVRLRVPDDPYDPSNRRISVIVRR